MILPSNMGETMPNRCNTDGGEILANIKFASTLPLSWLQVLDPIPGDVLIVGSGPSVRAFLPTIKARQEAGAIVVAINGSMKMLAEIGVTADYFVLLDARLESVGFLDFGEARHYLIASQCHASAFAKVAGKAITLWHTHFPGIESVIEDRECALIGGGSTVGLQSISIMYAIGYRSIDLYGFDSSYADGFGHAFAQPMNDGDVPEAYFLHGRVFMAAPWMARQAMEFQTAAKQFADGDAIVTVHGNGLLPEIAKAMCRVAGDDILPETEMYRKIWAEYKYDHLRLLN